MNIGFMDPRKKPTLIATTTAIMAAHYGVKIIYFNPQNIDQKNHLVRGKQYINNKWIPVTKKLPTLIDAASKSYKKDTREIMNYLRKNTVLTFDKEGTPSKEELQKLLYEDPEFSNIVIPTKRLDSFESLEKFIMKYNHIILKPNNGKQGKGIYSLKKEGDSYILSYDKKERIINNIDLNTFLNNYLIESNYLMQKMIISRTKEGHPFDCRVIVQKNHTGKWTIGKIFFRIGTGQKIVSNTSQGGSISDAKPFLIDNYESQWNDIYQKLKKLSVTLPNKFEKIKGTPTMDLGLDIGIDETGDLYLFEVNNGAAVKRLASISAKLRLEYYQYLIKNHPELKKIKKNINNNSKKLKLKKIRKERDLYKKKYNNIIRSKSWRLTKPFRKINTYLKK